MADFETILAGMGVKATAATLDRAVQELVDPIVASGPDAIRLQKELIIRWREADLTAAVRAGIAAFAACYTGSEPREGATAFLEKRPPRFGALR